MLIDQNTRAVIKALDLKHPYVWLATGLGVGFLRGAPGTWGSVLAIPLAVFLYSLWAEPGIIAGIILVTSIGFWAAGRFDQATGGHDNKAIVIDEIAGQWIALLPVFYFYGPDPFMIGLSFILFRLFDALKPWPVSFVEHKLKGPAGVMCDDLVAGLFTAACVEIVHYLNLWSGS